MAEENKAAAEAAIEAKKQAAEAKKAEAQAKKDAAAAAKAQAAAAKQAEKEAAKAAKAASSGDKEAAKLAKAEAAAQAKAEREAKAAEKLAAKEASKLPEQNGIKMRKPGTLSARVWEIADQISTQLNSPAPVANVLAITEAEKIDTTTARCQYAFWKKFHGLSGKITAPVAEAD